MEGLAKVTNIVAIVLAAGDAIRMDGQVKQLLPIGETNILERILIQLENRGVRTILVTHNEEIAKYHSDVHNPENRETTCDSLLSTSHLWEDKTIILLGDVVYSNGAFDRITNCKDRIRVFGNTAEIFAVVFNGTQHDKVKAALRKASKHRLGKLRYFYRHYCGLPVDMVERRGNPPERRVFNRIKDWTRDIDTPYHYERLLEEVVDIGKLDQ